MYVFVMYGFVSFVVGTLLLIYNMSTRYTRRLFFLLRLELWDESPSFMTLLEPHYLQSLKTQHLTQRASHINNSPEEHHLGWHSYNALLIHFLADV
jgi:hypothetical protein